MTFITIHDYIINRSNIKITNYKISGLFTDSENSVIQYSHVYLYASNNGSWSKFMNIIENTTTGNDGKFTFYNIEPGIYYISFDREYAPIVWYGGGIGKPIIIENSDLEINFQYPKGFNIYVEFDDRMSDIALCNFQKEIIISPLFSPLSNNITFYDLRPGEYYLSFRKYNAPSVWYDNPIIINNSDIKIDVHYPKGFNINGVYNNFDFDNDVMQEARVILYNNNKEELSRTRSLYDYGAFPKKITSFTFNDLQPGIYYLQFYKSGTPPAWYGGGKGEPIIIDKSDVSINFYYPEGGLNITGKYTDIDGNVMEHPTITLRDSNKEYLTRTAAKKDGSYLFYGLQSGKYYLVFSAKGFPSVFYGGGDGEMINIEDSDKEIDYRYNTKNK